MRLRPETVKTDQLLIDPNNPRYFDLRAHELVAPDRYAEPQIQLEAAGKLFAGWDVNELQNSILANGFIYFEYIVVKPYQHPEEYYVVIEGNRRLAAINRIRERYQRGVLPDEQNNHSIATSLDELQVLVFDGTEAEEKIIQGIRHVAGPKEWKSYPQALLIKDLHEVQGLSFERIQASLGLGPTTVRRVYRTLKAFEQMREDEEYSEKADPQMFSLFWEMLTRPPLRLWLGWSDSELRFCSNTNRKHMYRLIVEDDTGDDGPVRTIQNPQDMRTLSRILAHEYKERVIDRVLNGDITIDQAWAILEPGITPWEEVVASVTEALEKLPADELQSLSDEKERMLRYLAEVIRRKLEQASRLRPQSQEGISAGTTGG